MLPAVAHRRHAAGEIEPREGLDEIAVDARAGRVVQVLVHHHESGDHRLAGEIHDQRAGRDLRRRRSCRSTRCGRRG